MITHAISKCYGEVRVLFFRATTLVSARSSHSSGVRGLVVRWLIFNPEGSCSNQCVCVNFFLAIRSRFPFFRHYETSLPFRLCETFSKNVPKGSPFCFFLIFCTRMDVEKSQKAPFYTFRCCEIFQNEYFLS